MSYDDMINEIAFTMLIQLILWAYLFSPLSSVYGIPLKPFTKFQRASANSSSTVNHRQTHTPNAGKASLVTLPPLEEQILKTGDDEEDNDKLPPSPFGKRRRDDADSSDKDSKFLEYMDEEEIKDLTLKHYDLDEANHFYPAWTYDGFFSPKKWNEVNIDYFTYKISSGDDDTKRKRQKLHRSAMHLCSKAVTQVITTAKDNKRHKKCWNTIQNECENSMPSPINIYTEQVEENANFKEFVFTNFDNFFKFQMFLPEDGTDLLTLKFIPKQEDEFVDEGKAEDKDAEEDQNLNQDLPSVSRGAIGNHELFLDRIIFHVGPDRLYGSEHLINNEQFGMEIQFYFTPKNLTYWEALAQYKFMNESDPSMGKNVHVLSVLVKVATSGATSPDDPKASWTRNFDVLSQAAEMFWKSYNKEWKRAVKYKTRLLSLEDFLYVPTMGRYFTYLGSMTTPPCLTHLMWTVFERPIWITYDQWTKFAFIHSEFSDQKYLAGNFRPLQFIQMDVSVEVYEKMRLVKGEGEIEHKEMKEAKKMFGDGNVHYTVMYDHYEDFFAKRVWVSSQDIGEKAGDDDSGEWDYYETGQEGNRGFPTIVNHSQLHLMSWFITLLISVKLVL